MGEDFSIYNGEGTELRKAQLRMLDILTEIDKICKKHDIPYWIDFGTLLGAVRHKGFIPWDDDLDITIFKKDSKRLQQYLDSELPQSYYVLGGYSDPKFDRTGYFRVLDRNSHVLRPWQNESNLQDCHNGIWVDIFCIEPGRKSFKHFLDETHGKFLRRINHSVKDRIFNIIISYLALPFSSLILLLYRIIYLFFGRGHYIYHLRNCIVKQMFSERQKSDIFPLNEIVFEGMTFTSPHNPDAFLKETYGDYMTIPPKEKRFVHNTLIIVD